MESKKVIMFPKWKQRLEKESLSAIKARRFEDALEKLNELLYHKVETQEIYTGKLLCLMELERFEEAQDLCEVLVSERGRDYYSYIHIYLTLLFQTNQYLLLMEVASEELENDNIPNHLRKLFQELYTMSKNMQDDLNINTFHDELDDLFNMVNQENHLEQWHIINKLRKLAITPNEKIISLLVNEIVHPVNKTAIFLWVKDQGIEDKINVHKFGIELKLIPIETPPLHTNEIAIDIKNIILEYDQEDPSLYRMVEKLLKNYLFVLYPILPNKEDVTYIAQALIIIGNEFIHQAEQQTQNKVVEIYKSEIKTCEALYSSIIED